MGGERVVLVAEDEPVIGEVLAKALERPGLEVVVRPSVAEALEVARRRPVGVCLTDFLLLDRTGLELARELADVDAQVPVFVMSAFLEGEERRHLEAERNVVGLLRKPLDLHELRGLVESCLDRRSSRADPGEAGPSGPGDGPALGAQKGA